MPITKLTLTVDSEKIKLAKLFARANNISVSKMVEGFFSSLEGETNRRSKAFTRLRGGAKGLPQMADHKNLISQLLAEKYL